jgi:hypothetical protein
MRYLCLLVIFFSGLNLFSQSDSDAKLKMLSDKCSEYHRKTDGETDGYRIKIHFGIDKSAAREVKQKFSSKFNDILTYEEYRQPNFVIVVGDFKTRLDAFQAFKKIQPEFPNAFIIKAKVKPSRP